MADEFCLKTPDFHVKFRDFLIIVNLRNWTDGFTFLPNEGVLRIFSTWKIRLLRPGLNPRTWVPEASTLPVDHRSSFNIHLVVYLFMHFTRGSCCGAAGWDAALQDRRREFDLHCGHWIFFDKLSDRGVDSASNWNEYQGYLLWG